MPNLDTKTLKKALEDQFGKQAVLINHAFQGQQEYMDKRFERLDKHFKGLEGRITALEKQMAKLDNSMAALSSKVNNYLELSDKHYLELKRRDLIITKWIKMLADKSGIPIDVSELEKI